jgi:hypothetical protein
VFWDRRLVPGGPWPDDLRREVERAGCGGVVWSSTSIGSSWVLEEAESGRRRQCLIPMRLAAVTPPAELEDLHAADLVGWDGAADRADLQGVFAAIRKRLGARGDVTMGPTLCAMVIGDPGSTRASARSST